MTDRFREDYSIPEGETSVKPVSLIAVLVFAVVAIAHLVRLLFQVELVVGGSVVPLWVSVVGLFLAAALAFGLFREGREPRT
jgi:hypothetical protein